LEVNVTDYLTQPSYFTTSVNLTATVSDIVSFIVSEVTQITTTLFSDAIFLSTQNISSINTMTVMLPEFTATSFSEIDITIPNALTCASILSLDVDLIIVSAQIGGCISVAVTADV